MPTDQSLIYKLGLNLKLQRCLLTFVYSRCRYRFPLVGQAQPLCGAPTTVVSLSHSLPACVCVCISVCSLVCDASWVELVCSGYNTRARGDFVAPHLAPPVAHGIVVRQWGFRIPFQIGCIHIRLRRTRLGCQFPSACLLACRSAWAKFCASLFRGDQAQLAAALISTARATQ